MVGSGGWAGGGGRGGGGWALRARSAVRNGGGWGATGVWLTGCAPPQLADDPTARNSKRLPVKAKGEVRLRSVLSSSSSGMWAMPSLKPAWSSTWMDSSEVLDSILSSTSLSWRPRKTEMMAGGASLAPRRWALVALEMEAFSSPLCL